VLIRPVEVETGRARALATGPDPALPRARKGRLRQLKWDRGSARRAVACQALD